LLSYSWNCSCSKCPPWIPMHFMDRYVHSEMPNAVSLRGTRSGMVKGAFVVNRSCIERDFENPLRYKCRRSKSEERRLHAVGKYRSEKSIFVTHRGGTNRLVRCWGSHTG
jgi:hypothetical protein